MLDCLRHALRDLNRDGGIVATDMSGLTAAGLKADAIEVVPAVDDPAYLPTLLDLIDRYEIRLVVPTIDTELPPLAEEMEKIQARGAHVLVSGPETVAIGRDKRSTHHFLTAHDLPAPQQWTSAQARDRLQELPYPVVAKPAGGSSSVGVVRVPGPEQLSPALVTDDYVVESLAPGDEYTVDVWVDRKGAVRSAVPRRRLEVRGGEVSKGITERHGPVIDVAQRVAERLPDAYGPLTIQVFADGDSVKVIEINPRFGGGYPLSWEAGARTAVWGLQDALGLPLTPAEFGWREHLVMLRYDQSVFIDEADLTT